MKRIFPYLFALTIFTTSSPLFAGDLDIVKKDDEAVWRAGAGAQDSAYTSVAMSMLGWGLGLTAGIGILTSVLHQSTASTGSSHCH